MRWLQGGLSRVLHGVPVRVHAFRAKGFSKLNLFHFIHRAPGHIPFPATYLKRALILRCVKMRGPYRSELGFPLVSL